MREREAGDFDEEEVLCRKHDFVDGLYGRVYLDPEGSSKDSEVGICILYKRGGARGA